MEVYRRVPVISNDHPTSSGLDREGSKDYGEFLAALPRPGPGAQRQRWGRDSIGVKYHHLVGTLISMNHGWYTDDNLVAGLEHEWIMTFHF